METLVRIGDAWYVLKGITLTPTETPDTEPAEGSFIDGDAIAAELDGLDFDAMSEKTAEYVAAYEEARAKAGTGPEALSKAHAARVPAVVARHLREQRRSALEDLGELTETEAAVKPNTPASTPGTPATTPEGDTSENGGETTITTPETGSGDEEGTGEEAGGGDNMPEVTIPDDLSGLAEAELATVSAAARIVAKAKGIDPADAIASLMPGKGGVTAGAAAPARPAAQFKAAANLTGVSAGTDMSDDELAEEMSRWARSAKASRTAGARTFGSFMVYGDAPKLVTAAAKKGEKVEAGTELDALRAKFRGMTADSRPRTVQAAAPARCGPADVRRDIPDCGDMSSPLLDALQTYPAPHCELEYYRDISIASVADGITVWDDTARDAYQDALDAWREDVAGGGPFDPQLFADLKAAEKTCAVAGCAATDTVSMVPIAACLEYPTDLEYCSPQSIQAYRRALNRLFLRERTANMLAIMATFSIGVTVDAAAAPFLNDDSTPVQLGASAMLDYVITTLKPQGVMAERVTEGNYTLIMPYGLQRALELDNRLAEGRDALASAFGGVQVITTLDTATGTALPFGALPAVGSSNNFTTLALPTDWDMLLVDLDDFFEISRPNIEVGAQITPESIRGNMVFGGFMESTAGYGKDGCHPAWVVSLTNLVYNGARPDRMNLGDLLA